MVTRCCPNLHIVFSENDLNLEMSFKDNDMHLEMDFGEVQKIEKVIYVGGEPYEGSYVITPKVEEQILPTAMRSMKEDIRVEKIPYAEVSNHTGGKTVTIGG